LLYILFLLFLTINVFLTSAPQQVQVLGFPLINFSDFFSHTISFDVSYMVINAIEFVYCAEHHHFLRTYHIRFRLAKIKDISYQKKKLTTQNYWVLSKEACLENKTFTNQQAINYLGSSCKNYYFFIIKF